MNEPKLKNSLKQLGLFSFVAVLVAAIGCNRAEQDLGLDLQPEDDLMAAYYADTITLAVTTEMEDSLKTDELSSVMMGNYSDPATGTHRADFYTQLRLSTNGANFPQSYELDSVIFSLAYTGRFYGKLNPQELEVNELLEDMYLDSAYRARTALAYDHAVNLVLDGSEVQPIRPLEYVTVDGDSLSPQLRIPLDHSFGERIMNLRGYNLSNSQRFQDELNGLRVASRTINGAVVNFDLTDSDTRLTLYYRDLDGEEADTTSYSFIVNDLCARYTHTEHQYPGSDLSGIGEQLPLSGETTCYVQGGGTLKIRIDIPFLQNFYSEGRTINVAELILPVSDIDNKHYPPQDLLFILANDPDSTISILPDQVAVNHSIGGNLDVTAQEYRFNISRWVQQVLLGTRENNGLYIVSGSAGVSMNRAVIHGPEFSMDDPLLNMRLRLIYSE